VQLEAALGRLGTKPGELVSQRRDAGDDGVDVALYVWWCV
jgi:hypothetical protein